MATPESWEKIKNTRTRLQKCWEIDLDWSLLPVSIKEGCHQVASALNLPPTAVLGSYILLGGFLMSPAVVEVPGTDWVEPVLVWLTIAMPTGSGKSTLFRHMYKILCAVRTKLLLNDEKDPSWVFDDGSFEKMGALIHANAGRLLGVYDEMSAFLSQINLYRGRGLSDSHELALFLQLYNGHPWRRDTVSGEANFVMKATALTIGGFTQPSVARALIDIPSNAEKGLSHRFIWLFPQPVFKAFDTLGEVNQDFVDKLIELFAKQWRPSFSPTKEIPAAVFRIMNRSPTFGSYYDEVQDGLKSMAGLDEYLQGMLSKSRSHVLRLAAVIHVLGCIDNPDNIPCEISENSLKAAVNIVQHSCQQTAFIAGRESIKDEIENTRTGVNLSEPGTSGPAEVSTAEYTLSLPGKTLYLTHLLALKKYRKKGNKDGALRAFQILEAEGLGKLIQVGSGKGIHSHFEFVKEDMPENIEEKKKFAKKLSKFNMSLSKYQNILLQKELKPILGKRMTTPAIETPTRKSPRKHVSHTSISPRDLNKSF